MQYRHGIRISAFFVALLFGQTAVAYGDAQPFRQESFDRAMKDGDSIVIHFHSKWCTTCAAQQEMIETVMANRPDEMVDTVFVASWQDQRHVARAFDVFTQATLIRFDDSEEHERVVAQTDGPTIKALVTDD